MIKITNEVASQLAINEGCHEIEASLMLNLMGLGRSLLSRSLLEKASELDSLAYVGKGEEPLARKGLESRSYLSLFGPIVLERQSYWSEQSGKVHALDEVLQLPVGTQWSYNLQKMVGAQSSEVSYEGSVNLFNDLLGLRLSGKSASRNAAHLGVMAGSFYEQEQPAPTETGLLAPIVHASVSFDGKGVPVLRPKQEEGGNPKRRLGKGEKNGRTKSATVVAASHFTPSKRSKADVLHGLGLGEDSEEKPEKKPVKTGKWHYETHRRGFLDDQAKAVQYGIEWVKKDMENGQSRFVVPIDGGAGLEAKVLAEVEKAGLGAQFDGIVMDIIHVNEYVWDTATAIFGEKSKSRKPWVRDVMDDLLEGKADKVVGDLVGIVAKTELSDSKFEQVMSTLSYLLNHKHKMRYKEFLEKGYPISSAMAESTCKHLVKDRLATSGTRWKEQGAQNMLDLRAVHVNKDMDGFMAFVVAKEHQTLNIKAA